MAYETDADGVLCAPPMRQWFGLGRDSYLVMPRLALEAMPHEWQRRFIALMDETEAAGLETPAYHVLRADPDYTYVLKYDEDDDTSRDYEFTAWSTDPWSDYRHGDINELCPSFKGAAA